MDILRKELNAIYASQRLEEEVLDDCVVEQCRVAVRRMAEITGGCCVITDAASDRCYVYASGLARLMGWEADGSLSRVLDSSDEDFIYNGIHPEDLPDKRLLEYEFFKFVHPLSGRDKLDVKATCRIRIKDKTGQFIWLNNSTQVLCPSPKGKIWLILCCYELSSDQTPGFGIDGRMRNNATGEMKVLIFKERRQHLLTDREKEILSLIKDGKSSKMIAGELGISINTVNRHRQNILEKLSVANSFEAISAAESMRLL